MSSNQKIDKRIKRTKKALQNALITLMQSHDFKAITITDIVEHADYNRGTFYKHYKYKEELLEDIIEEVIKDLVDSYRQPYQHTDSLTFNSLSASAVKIFEHVYAHANFYQLIIQSNALPGFHKRITNELKKLPLQDLAEIEPSPDIDPELHASYQAYAIFGMIMEWGEGGFKLTPAYMADQLLEMLKFSPVNSRFKIRSDLEK
ncbi:TetR/AcrR family transcriptional regulator [Sediminibacillus halophilus]|uniref:DNA-binding transcriptional regulator, AcrR family n=1 Tax=Sediminibacillus halophilus TaxID=482461 RepID=A0A1G9V994_9BACI|nr:TetR/AcrR family transcriptional regulator [Sediminibacillus halophilus]SDM68455.1 DNA-binding transcriptional regulator, AcrR family [Sediminibacillus halophilus]